MANHIIPETALPPKEDAVQLDLFSAPDDRWQRYKKIEQTLDDIRTRYGRGAIGSGAFLDNEIGIHLSDEEPEEKGDDNA